MANFVNAAVNWAGKMVASYKAGPPKVYMPEYHTWKAWMTKWAEVQRENGGGMDGFWVAFNKARVETVFRKGTLVGTDGNGNKCTPPAPPPLRPLPSQARHGSGRPLPAV